MWNITRTACFSLGIAAAHLWPMVSRLSAQDWGSTRGSAGDSRGMMEKSELGEGALVTAAASTRSLALYGMGPSVWSVAISSDVRRRW